MCKGVDNVPKFQARIVFLPPKLYQKQPQETKYQKKKLPEEGSQTPPPHLQLKKSVYILDVAREPILAPDGQWKFQKKVKSWIWTCSATGEALQTPCNCINYNTKLATI